MAAPPANRRRRLAIIGASARAAAQSALRAGFEVVTADLFADRDLISVTSATRIDDYPVDLPPWLAQCEADAWLYTGALENQPDLIDRMAQVKPLWGNQGAAIRAARDHSTLRAELSKTGLHYPEAFSSGGDVPLTGEWLAKTRRGSSGSGVWVLDSPAAWQRATQENAEIERRLTQGYPASAVFVLNGAHSMMLGVTQQLVGPALSGALPFQYAGSIHPCVLSEIALKQLANLQGLLANRLGLRGLVNVDLWIDGDRVSVLEVNPRYSASMELLERATGQSAIARHAAVFGADGRMTPGGDAAPGAVGKLILFAKREVSITPEFSDWAFSEGDLADIPLAGQTIQGGWPVLTLFSEGAHADAEALFARRVAHIEERLYA